VPVFSSSQHGIPKIRGVGFDTQQRVIGSLTAIAGIVTDLSAVLMSEHRYDRAVEIKNEAGAMFGQVDEFLQQSVVDAMKLFPETVWCLE
jgi:ribosomal protein S13